MVALLMLICGLIVSSWVGVGAQDSATCGGAILELNLVTGELGGLVEIGGRSFWLNCQGAGSPTVNLEPANFQQDAEQLVATDDSSAGQGR
jgi:hypothetical protein